MKDKEERLHSASQPQSRSISPTMSRQGSRVNLRSHHRPIMNRHSSLADLAREHRLHSRNSSSSNDIRKFYMPGGYDQEIEHEDEEEMPDEYVLLSPADHQLNAQAPLHLQPAASPQPHSYFHLTPHRHESPESPNFLLRTGSRVFTHAGLELGESRHNSPTHSLANSREVSSDEEEIVNSESGNETSELERVLYMQLHTDSDDEYHDMDEEEAEATGVEDNLLDDDDDDDDNNVTSAVDAFESGIMKRKIWRFVVKDLLGFDMRQQNRRGSVDLKQKRRNKTTGLFDPALALALFVAFVK